MKMRDVAGEPLAEHDLLLVAAAQQPDRLRRRRLDAQIGDDRLGQRRLARARQNTRTAPAGGRAAARCCARPSGPAPGPAPCDPPAAGRCRARSRRPDRGTGPRGRCDEEAARVWHRSAPAITRASSVRPAPSSPAMPSTSPACSEKLMSAQRAAAADVLDARAARRRARRGPWESARLRSRLAISRTSSGTVTSLNRPGRDVAAVAQHGDPVADAKHLVEPVRDVDDRDAARGQPLDQREQLRRLRGSSATTSARPSPGSTRACPRAHRGGREAPWRSPPSAAAPARGATPACADRACIPRSASSARRAVVQRAPVDDAGPAASAPRRGRCSPRPRAAERG